MPGATFSWTNSNTSIGLVANGSGNVPAFIATNSGTTTITATITVYSTANSCTSLPTIYTITVNPNPVITPVATPATICSGASSSLSASSAVAGTTYLWNPGGLTGTPVSVTPGSTTTYSVTGNASGCTGTATVTVTVNPNPVITPTAIPTAICNGGSSSLTASSSIVGTTYLWNPGGLLGTPITVTPVSTTTYTVTGTAASCTGTAIVTVTVNPNPVITQTAIPAIICNGASSSLSASSNIIGTTYLWNPGGLSGTPVSVTPGSTTIYTVTGTAAGCTGSATVKVTVSPNPIITPTAIPAIICNGSSSSLSASSTVVGTTYLWNPGGLTGTPVSVTPGSTTTYTVTGTASSCTGTATITVTVNPNPVITPTATPSTICNEGSSSLTASSNIVGTTYLWNPGGLSGTPVSVTPVSTTVYTVTGTAAGCTGTATITVTVHTNPVITPTATPATICNGGSSSLTASSNVAGTTYLWNPGGLVGTPVSVTPGSTTVYTVIGTAAGCTGTATITVTVNPNPVITPTAIPGIICNGGSSLLTASSNIVGTTYLWNPDGLVGTPVSVTPISTTTYTVTGTAAGCTGTATVTVTVSPNPVITPTATPATICNGGSSSLSASSNIAGTTYLWNPGGLAGTPVSVTPGSTTIYTVIGTAAGCTGTATVKVTVSPNPVITPTTTPATICNGGSSSLTASSTVAGTTYLWNPGGLAGTPVSVTPIATTTYTVTGTATGCTGTATVTVTVNPKPVITPTATPSTICNGGSSSLTASSTVVGTTFIWNPGGLAGTPVTVTPAATTTYTVTGSAAGCTGTATITVTVSPKPVITPTATPAIICAGDLSSLAASSTIVGTTYVWNPGGLVGSPVSVTPASTTTYTVTGTAAGCTGTATVKVSVNPAPVITTTATPAAICTGDASSLSASSNIAGTTFLWNPSGSVGTPVSVTPGTTTIYTVTGTSPLGCTASATVMVTVNPIPVITPTATPATICNGGPSSLTASSNVAGTTYLWNPGGMVGTPVSVTPGSTTIYTIIGTASGCTGTATITVTVNPKPVITPTATPATICSGESSSLTASSSIAGTTYLWNPGGLTGTPVSVTPGISTTYIVTGTATGCTGTATVTVTVNPTPVITPTATPSTICNGGSSSLSASSTVVGTTYLWNPGGLAGTPVTVTPVIVTPGSTITYTVTGTAVGCTGTATITVTVNPNPVITPTAIPAIICAGDVSSLTASSTVVGTTYLWNPGGLVGSPVSVTPASTTTYTVTGTAAGCTGTATVKVSVNPAPIITPTATPAGICTGDTSSLSVSSTIAGTTYLWNPGSLVGTPVSVTPGLTTIYTVTGTSPLGCTASATVMVTVNPIPVITPTATPATICNGASSSLTAISSVGGTTYLWNPGGLVGTPVSVTPGSTTSYTVTGGDVAGCTGTATVEVSVNPNPVITSTATPTTICNGESSSLNASSTIVGTTFIWNPGSLAGTPVSVTPGITTTFTVTGTAAGCTGTDTVTVNVNPTPIISPIAIPAAICTGDTASLSASSDIVGTTFLWNPGGITGTPLTVTPPSTTIYTVTGTSPLSCTATATVTVTVNPIPVITPTAAPDTICNGASSSLTASSTVAGTTYLWNPSGLISTPVTVTPGSTTIYTVTGTAASCAGTANVTVIVNPTPTVTALPNIIVCAGDTIPTTAFSGSIPGSTFDWTNSNTAIGLAASGTGNIPPFATTNTGTLPITAIISVTSTINNCTSTPTTYNITVNPLPTVEIPANMVVCNGATVPSTIFSSLTPGATFAWTNSDTTIGLSASGTGNIPVFTASNSGTTPITATITVTTSANGCTGSPVTFTITVNMTSTVTVPANIIACPGDTIPATAFTGSVVGATFDWINSNTAIGLGDSGSGNIPSFIATNSGSTPITSIITVTASINNCTGLPTTYNITVNPSPSSSFTVTTPVCNLDSTVVQYTGTGDTSAIFSWNFDGGTATATTGLENYLVFWPTSGIFTVSLSVTQNGCISSVTTDTVSVSNINLITNTINNVSCFGLTDGSAIVIASNGLGNYSYLWNTSPPQNTPNATNLGAGTYLVIVTDSVNCSKTDSVVITEPQILSASAQASEQVTCHDYSDGSITVTAQGGTGPYSYALNGGTPQNSNIFSELPPDSYSIVVTDSNGCTTTILDIFITNPDSITAMFINYSNSNCFGSGGGSVEIVAAGGTQPYSYLWSNGATTASVSDLKNQTYYITVTDLNQCTGEFSIEVVKDPKVDLIIHNSFSPNGDGKNDIWFIENLNLYPENELVVLNRWGNEVFSVNGYMNNWDGGNLNEGTYFYVLKVNMCNDFTTFKGYVTILK
jgi:gliding motility-associated-like protein